MNNSSAFLVILNPRAGGVRRLGRPRLERTLNASGHSCELVEPASIEETAERARRGAVEGRVVVAAGGDGTIHIVANGVLSADRKDAVMGVLPLGSGNDFASSLGRPGDGIAAAITALREAKATPIDVGRVNGGEFFVNGLGIGFDAEVVRRREGRRAGVLGYFPTVASSIRSYAPRAYRIGWDSGHLEATALMLAVMNGAGEGGGFRLTPDARLDDGAFDICWIDPISLWQFARYVLAVRRGTHAALPMVKMWKAASLSVESDEPLSYHLDGEYRQLAAGTALHVELFPKRLNVIA